jgi:predicted nucleic acid-binding protein
MVTTDTTVICDAGPLIHLGELNAVDLLSGFQSLLVPEQVWSEVDSHFPAALSIHDIKLTRVSIPLANDVFFHTLVRAFVLDIGEQAALSLMQQHPDAILLTDDMAARLAAKSMGYRVHGTLGVIVRAVRQGTRTLDEVITLLQAIPTQSTLYVRPQLLHQTIELVQSEFLRR